MSMLPVLAVMAAAAMLCVRIAPLVASRVAALAKRPKALLLTLMLPLGFGEVLVYARHRLGQQLLHFGDSERNQRTLDVLETVADLTSLHGRFQRRRD